MSCAGTTTTWTKSLSALKTFNINMLHELLQSRGIVINDYSKGYQFFIEGYIHKVEVEVVKDGTVEFSVRGKCHHSQRRNEKPHSLCLCFAQVETGLQLKMTHCSCVIGLSESCHHIVGLNYYLQHLVMTGADSIPEDITCTSRAMEWNKPRGKKISPENIMAVTFVKPYKLNRTKKPIQYRHCVPKTSVKGRKPEAATLRKKTKDICSQLVAVHKEIPFSYLIDIENQDESMSTMAMQKQDLQVSAIANNVERVSLPQFNMETVNVLISLPLPNKTEFANFTISDSIAIEEKTRAQSESPEWFKYRKELFTASNFKKICSRQVVDEKFITELQDVKNLNHIPAIRHGKSNETVARDLYVQTTGNKVLTSGLVIHPYAPYLGASPDGIVVETSTNEPNYGLLEIKCPFGKKTSTVNEALKLKTFIFKKDENNQLEFRTNHQYYYQMQGQMLLTGLLWCDCVVFFKKSNEMLVKRLEYDETFCTEMYVKLTAVYTKHVLKL